MAKEPALLAEIRANRARVEKAAKEQHGAPLGLVMPALVVEVTTPEVKAPPNNYIATALVEHTTVAHCEELLAHAKQHGYADDGQTVQLIRAKIDQLRSHARESAPTKKARRRGGRR